MRRKPRRSRGVYKGHPLQRTLAATNDGGRNDENDTKAQTRTGKGPASHRPRGPAPRCAPPPSPSGFSWCSTPRALCPGSAPLRPRGGIGGLWAKQRSGCRVGQDRNEAGDRGGCTGGRAASGDHRECAGDAGAGAGSDGQGGRGRRRAAGPGAGPGGRPGGRRRDAGPRG